MPTTYELDPLALAWVLLGLVIGLVLGRLTWGRAARRHRRVADSVANAASAAAARTQAEAAQRELAAAQAAMRPLADEIDRLKRELARARRPLQPPLPLGSAPTAAAPPAAAPTAAAPTPAAPGDALYAAERAGLPAAAPVAGTGPLVVGDGPGSGGPDIRRLKGVGDKFAVALAGLGLGTIDALARLNADEAADADTQLGAFNGRIARDRLVEQAVLIDEGRMTEYETRFGKLGGPVLI